MLTDDGPPPDLRDLIRRYFDSVESVEIVLLLRRSPQTFWAADAVSVQLGIQREVAAAKLGALAANGILALGPETHAYRYAPATDEIGRSVDDLAAAYAGRRLTVINTIYSANLERLRTFSNAFKVK